MRLKKERDRTSRATREFCTAEHLAHAMGGTVRRAHEASETRVTLYPFGPPMWTYYKLLPACYRGPLQLKQGQV